MDQRDTEHLRLLVIFHYVMSGVMALFALIFVSHIVIGYLFTFHPELMNSPDSEELPSFFGWIFLVSGSVTVCLGLTLAALIFFAARSLAARRRYTFCFVVAALLCLNMPLGTALGVFTILVLSRESVKAEFQRTAAELRH